MSRNGAGHQLFSALLHSSWAWTVTPLLSIRILPRSTPVKRVALCSSSEMKSCVFHWQNNIEWSLCHSEFLLLFKNIQLEQEFVHRHQTHFAFPRGSTLPMRLVFMLLTQTTIEFKSLKIEVQREQPFLEQKDYVSLIFSIQLVWFSTEMEHCS